jgi:hypothetical protein
MPPSAATSCQQGEVEVHGVGNESHILIAVACAHGCAFTRRYGDEAMELVVFGLPGTAQLLGKHPPTKDEEEG